MNLDRNAATRDYITRVLGIEPHPPTEQDEEDTYHWTSGNLSLAHGYRTSSGWGISLDSQNSVFVDFADATPEGVQDFLKTIIGHCVVEGLAIHTPWQIIPARREDGAT